MTPRPAQSLTAPGPVGDIALLADLPSTAPQGLAIVAHPHPLFGGANTNKVVHTLARTYAALGYVALRPNFRGVGGSAGTHDHGQGETEDLLAVIAWALARWALPARLALAGFSFGAYVQTRVARRLLGLDDGVARSSPVVSLPLGHSAPSAPDEGMERPTPSAPHEGIARASTAVSLQHLLLVGLPHGLALGSGTVYDTPELPAELPVWLIHGEEDQVAPLSRALAWARPQARPVCVVPGADHFFHGKLTVLAAIARRLAP